MYTKVYMYENIPYLYIYFIPQKQTTPRPEPCIYVYLIASDFCDI